MTRGIAWALAVSAPMLWAQDEKPRTGAPVTVPVVVRDKKGAAVVGLGKDNFAVKVDGTVQPVRMVSAGAGKPVTYGLVVDVGDGEKDHLNAVQHAARALVAGLQPGDKMFVVQFAHEIELLQEPTADKPALEKALNLLGTPSPSFHPHREGPEVTRDEEGRKSEKGGTSLNDAVYLSCEEVLARETGRRVLVVASDGVDIRSKKSSTEVVESIERTGTVVYTAFLPSKQMENGPGSRPGQRNGNGTGNGGGNNRGGIGFPGSYPGGGYPGGGTGNGGGNNPNGGNGGGQQPNGGGERSHRPNVDGTQVLTKMSRTSGGRLINAEKHGSLESQFASVGEDLKTAYWVEFTPTGAGARHSWHIFDIDVTGSDKSKKVEVQAPEGFYTGS